MSGGYIEGRRRGMEKGRRKIVRGVGRRDEPKGFGWL